MKKVFAFALVFAMVWCIACADTIDLTKMTERELTQLRTAIDTELAKRASQKGEQVLYEDNSIKVVYEDNFTESSYIYGTISTVHFKVTNKSNDTIEFYPSSRFEQYQNNVSLEMALTDYFQISVKIRPGATADVYSSCVVTNNAAPILVVYNDIAEMTILLK